MKKTLYPPIEPFAEHMLKVSDVHTIHVEECGAKPGPGVISALVLHGGPGGGIAASYRQYFNPEKYHVVLFSQRGAGKSTPAANLEENTTWKSVEDAEKIREMLKIERWVVFGGSWGSTLSLAYAQTHPDRVLALILRGIFTLRHAELQWFYQEGASWLYPAEFEAYKNMIPEEEQGDLIGAYSKRLTSDNADERLKFARAWSTWECLTSKMVQPENLKLDDTWVLQFARIENHYFVNKGFFECDDQIIRNAAVLEAKKIPCIIAQGNFDVVCPAKTAYDLCKVYRSAQLKIVLAGHSASEPEIINVLVGASDQFAETLLK